MTKRSSWRGSGKRRELEWVNGEVIVMSPVNLEHDAIQGWLYRLFCEFVG